MSTIDKLLSGASWFCDGWDPNLKLFHRLRSKLFETLSPYQRVEIYDTDAFGRMLVIDGLPQAAEQDEMIYAKAIAWPAILNLKREKRILITGGGDGHVLREALRFPSVVAVTVCDIDPSVTAATLEWMPFMWNNCDKDPRALLVRADALEYLASRPPASLEIVISDITDPTGEETASHHLYSAEYFARIKRCLSRGGVCVAQAQELSLKSWAHHKKLHKLMSEVFGHVRSAAVYVPSFNYPQGFLFASDAAAAVEFSSERLEQGLHAANLTGDPHFDASSLGAMFILPPLLRTQLASS